MLTVYVPAPPEPVPNAVIIVPAVTPVPEITMPTPKTPEVTAVTVSVVVEMDPVTTAAKAGWVKLSVDELVHVRLAAIPVVPSVPPFMTTCDANVALADGFNLSSPEVTVVLPVKANALLVRISTPVLVLVIPPVPLIEPA